MCQCWFYKALISFTRGREAGCSKCGGDKVRGVLDGFEAAERDHMFVDGKVIVTCEFCNATYDFDPEELGR